MHESGGRMNSSPFYFSIKVFLFKFLNGQIRNKNEKYSVLRNALAQATMKGEIIRVPIDWGFQRADYAQSNYDH